MSTAHNSQLVRWPVPIGPPTLPSHALRAAQTETLAAPRLRYDPFSRLMFFTVNVLYGRRPSLAKFLVLEHLARIPYQTWERVAQRAIARTEGRSHLALRIMDRVVEARAQQDNEQFHLLIIDELLVGRGAPGRFRYRILPRLLAGPWHAFTWLLHLIRPAWSYRLNANFEDHAEHEYMHFVASHPELDHEPAVCDAAHGLRTLRHPRRPAPPDRPRRTSPQTRKPRRPRTTPTTERRLSRRLSPRGGRGVTVVEDAASHSRSFIGHIRPSCGVLHLDRSRLHGCDRFDRSRYIAGSGNPNYSKEKIMNVLVVGASGAIGTRKDLPC